MASNRTLAPRYVLDFDWRRAHPATFPKDDDAWVEVLRRPPESWSAGEVAAWAQRPRELYGGQLGDLLARRLWDNAIDGYLLLSHSSAGAGGSDVGSNIDEELIRVLGVTDPGQRRALAQAIAQLRTQHDRILSGDIALPPPRELLEQMSPALPQAAVRPMASAAGATGRFGPPPTSVAVGTGPMRSPQGAGNGIGGRGGGGGRGLHGGTAAPGASGRREGGGGAVGRPVGLSVKEQILFTAHQQAASATVANLATATNAVKGRDSKVAAAVGLEARAGSGGLKTAPMETGLRRMAELVAAHDDVVRRLQVLRLEGTTGLERYEARKQQQQQPAQATAVAENNTAVAAAAAAGGTTSASDQQRRPHTPTAMGPSANSAVPNPDLEELKRVEERGRALRAAVAGQTAEVEELTREPLDRTMMRRRTAAAVAAAGGGSAGEAGGGGGGFNGTGARAGWAELHDGDGSAAANVRQGLSATGAALLAELDEQRDNGDYDPWVYDDDDEDDQDEANEVEDEGDSGQQRAVAAVRVKGGGGGKSSRSLSAVKGGLQVSVVVQHRGRQGPDVSGSGGGGGPTTRHIKSTRGKVAHGGTHSGGGGGGGSSGGPLQLLEGLPRGRGREPGSHAVHPPQPGPDPWRTADGDAVRMVLARGASTPVHHTLKSKLAEDAVRHMYGIQTPQSHSRTAGVAPGDATAAPVPFFPSASLLTNHRAASHEVALRCHLGLPVGPELVAARSLTAPRTARRVVKEVPLQQQPQEPQQPGPSPNQTGVAGPHSGTSPSPRRVHFRTPGDRTDTHTFENLHPPASQAARPLSGESSARRPRPALAPLTGSTVIADSDRPRGHPADIGFNGVLPIVATAASNGYRQLTPPEARVRGIGTDRDGDQYQGPRGGSTSAVVGYDNIELAAVAAAGGMRGGDGDASDGDEDDGSGRDQGARTLALRQVAQSVARRAAASVERGPAGRSTSASRIRGAMRVGTFLKGEWGDPDLQASVQKALRMLNGGTKPTATSGAASQQRQERRTAPPKPSIQNYCYKNGALVYTGRRPPFSAEPEHPYELPGWHPRPMGQSWTKVDAERLAGAVSGCAGTAGSCRTSELHWAAGRGDVDRVRQLLASAGSPQAAAALVNLVNCAGQTPLHRAASCPILPGAIHTLECLLAAGADTDPQDGDGATPLMCVFTAACWHREGGRRVRMLLAAGARVGLHDCAGETVLHKAILHVPCCVDGSANRPSNSSSSSKHSARGPSSLSELIRLLIPASRQEQHHHHHQDQQHSAGYHDGPGGFEMAEENSSDNHEDHHNDPGTGNVVARAHTRNSALPRSGQTNHALATAAGAGTSGAFIATVVAAAAATGGRAVPSAAAAAVNDVGPSPSPPPPQSSASFSRSLLDGPDTAGRTPLHLACSRPHTHGPDGEGGCSVAVLLEAGADPRVVDGSGRTPLHWALAEAAASGARFLRSADCINHCKMATRRVQQPMGALCWVVQRLLLAGADPSARQTHPNGGSVHSSGGDGAAEGGRGGDGYNNDARCGGSGGATPLHLAVYSRSRSLVRLLLRFGADPRVRDAAGRTAADVVREAVRAAGNDCEQVTQLNALLDVLQRYEQQMERVETDINTLTTPTPAHGAAHQVAGPNSCGQQGAVRGRYGTASKGRVDDKPGLGGGAGPKTLRQLYHERFGDSSEEEEEEVEVLPRRTMQTHGSHQSQAPSSTQQQLPPEKRQQQDDLMAVREEQEVEEEAVGVSEGRGDGRQFLTGQQVPNTETIVEGPGGSLSSAAVAAPYGLEHDRAATRIQAVWRGRQARMRYQHVRQAVAKDKPEDLGYLGVGYQQDKVETLPHRRATQERTVANQHYEGGGEGRDGGSYGGQAMGSAVAIRGVGRRSVTFADNLNYKGGDLHVEASQGSFQNLAGGFHGSILMAGAVASGAGGVGDTGPAAGRGGDRAEAHPRPSNPRRYATASDDGSELMLAGIVGGMSGASSTAASLALPEGPAALEAPPPIDVRHSSAGAGDGGRRNSTSRHHSRHTEPARRGAGGAFSGRAPRVPQMDLGNMDDTDLLDLDEEDEEGQAWGEDDGDDGSLPSGLHIEEYDSSPADGRYSVVQHDGDGGGEAAAEGDGDSVF